MVPEESRRRGIRQQPARSRDLVLGVRAARVRDREGETVRSVPPEHASRVHFKVHHWNRQQHGDQDRQGPRLNQSLYAVSIVLLCCGFRIRVSLLNLF